MGERIRDAASGPVRRCARGLRAELCHARRPRIGPPERLELTRAVEKYDPTMAGAAAQWLLLQRLDERDKFLVFGGIGETWARVALTTSADGSELRWAAVRLEVGRFRAAVPQAGGGHAAPVGVPGASVNWMCDIPDSVDQVEARGRRDPRAVRGGPRHRRGAKHRRHPRRPPRRGRGPLECFPTLCAIRGLLPLGPGDGRVADLPVAAGPLGPNQLVGSAAAGSGGAGLGAREGPCSRPSRDRPCPPWRCRR